MTTFRTIVAESDGTSVPRGWYYLTWTEEMGVDGRTHPEQAPAAYGPFPDPGAAVAARDKMLGKMVNAGHIRANLYMPDGSPFVSPKAKV